MNIFKKFRNLKLGRKQKLVFGIILILFTAVHFYSIHTMRTLKSSLDETTNNWLPRAIAISDINLSTTKLRLNQLQYVFASDESTRQEQAEIMINLIDKINANLDIYEELKRDSEKKDLYSQEERGLYTYFDEKWGEYQDLSFSFHMMSRENKIEEAVELLNSESEAVFIDLGATLDALVSVNQQDAFNASSRADHTFRAARFITTVILLIAIFLSIILAGILGRYVTTPVRQLEIAAKSVADGNLDIQLEVVSEDEIGSLSSSFNQMALSLSEARKKTTQQAERLQSQHRDLQHAFNQLELKSSELEQKNIELEDALHKLGEAQEQLIIKEKMASLGNLVAGIAHEINNPIGAVNSAVDNMKRAINRIKLYLSNGKTLEQIKKNVRFQKTFKLLEDNSMVTVTASQRISRIVKSLRNFARLDEADFQKADVHEGLDSTLTLVHHELRNKVEVIKNYGKLPSIYCFPNELNQVFMNLFVNAAQAIKEKGKLTISTKKDKKHINIKITDTGNGIPKEKLKKIFDPGFTTKGVGVGTGLGLSISYNIIKKHNGEIEVKSKVGKGTQFTIRLPIEQQRRTI